METIITLLILLVPVVFRLIGKALENASQDQTVPHQREVSSDSVGPAPQRPVCQNVVRRQDAVTPIVQQEGESVVDIPVQPVQTVQVAAEDKPKRKKKIDPKKLIVYSEIMKPKY